MPLALLLAEPLAALRTGVQRRWRRWEALAATEALVLTRARSAFLVRWFGTVPIDGIHVKVMFDNQREIQDALGDLRGRRTGPEKPSLLEPLLGGTGALAGALAFPMNSMAVGVALANVMQTWWAVLYSVLNWLAFGAIGLAAFTVGAPVIAGFAAAALALRDDGPPARRILEHLAAIGLQLRELYDQITSGAVKNPLLRAALELGDIFAGLVVQLAGSLLWILSRVVPRLGPLSSALVAGVALGRTLVGVLMRILDDVKVSLPRLLDREHGPLAFVSTVLKSLGRVLIGVGRSVSQIPQLLRSGIAPLRAGLTAWWKGFDPKVVVTKHPLVIALTKLTPSIGTLITHLKDIVYGLLKKIPVVGPPLVGALTSPSGPFMTKVKKMALDKAKAIFNPPPPLPPWPTIAPLRLPKTAAIPEPFTPADPASASSGGPDIADAYAAVRKAQEAKVVDAFAGEAARLRVKQDRARVHAAEVAAYLRLARHAVAPVAAEAVRGLEDVLRELDRKARPPSRRVYPVRGFPAAQPLRPKVKRLVVTAEARHEAPVRRYARSLQRAMGAQVYELELVL